ncbi:alpha/beta fold hydrolase, partial [Pseudomonadota bacterium]
MAYDKDFPDVTIWDIADFTAKAMDQIGVNDIHCVVGPSMGGMTALAWVTSQVGRTKHMLNISSALEADPFAIALRSLQREMIKSDVDYK